MLEIEGTEDPVVSVVDEASGELVYAVRILGRKFSPKVFRPGTYTVTVRNGAAQRVIKAVHSLPKRDESSLVVRVE